MILNISNQNLTVIKNGIYHFELSDYPRIKDYELNNIITFISYEKKHGRQTEVICEDSNVLSVINNAVAHFDGTENILQLAGNEFVYHATNIEATKQILASGKLLSAVKVYGKTGEELAFERYESSDGLFYDPADYFEFIMFCEGDTPIGDYVVLSDNFPNEEDLVNGNFNAGVRFYFRYEDIIRHPEHTFDGYHAIKVKDEIVLSDYLYTCIVPEQYKNEIENYVSSELAARVHYLSQKGLGLSDWNEKVYDFVCNLRRDI